MFRPRTAEIFLAVAVLVGVSTFAFARMGQNEERSIPYQGFIEQDGVAITGTLTARFGLFSTAGANTSCVLTNTCSLWSEEQVISIVNGRFGVILGDGTGPTTLSDAVLGQPALFLAVALKDDADAAFTALGGVQEIVAGPLTGRAANADRAGFATSAASATTAGSVGGNGVSNGSIQAGAVTRDKLAATLFYSANFILGADNIYRASNVTPAQWLESNNVGTDGTNVTVFPISNTPPNGYKCAVTALGTSPRFFGISNASPGQLTIRTYAPGGGGGAGSFMLFCEGF